jgi:hypothetical protein
MRHATCATILAGLVLVGCASAGYAQHGRRWEELGRRRVDFGADRDVIEVGRHEGRFRELRLDVDGAPVELYEMKVVFEDGDTFRVGRRLLFDSDGWTRSFDLPGHYRRIRRVEFRYRTVGHDRYDRDRYHDRDRDRRGRSTLTLYGR